MGRRSDSLWLSARTYRLAAGLVVGLYVLMHLLNHALGLISVHAQESARPWFMGFWHSPPGQVLLYGSLILHAGMGLYIVARRRHYWMPPGEALQLGLGLAIPYLLLVHIINTRGTRILTGIDIDYVYEITNLWVSPVARWNQIILVLLVWGHFALGLHLWLRNKGWYRPRFALMLVLYIMVPAGGLLGFADTGKTMTARAMADPAWYKAVKAHGVPADPRRAALRVSLKAWVGPAWLVLVAAVFLAAQARNFLERRHRFKVTYPGGTVIEAPRGMSILEVSRLGGYPHMSVCGGRARCTTCRVQVISSDAELPHPALDEARALARIGAPRDVRLACQTRPEVNVRIRPLLNPRLLIASGQPKSGQEFGHEQKVTVMFIDLRGSTTLAERRLPYDVVFFLNDFFAEMAGAVEKAGGHYSNFTGDGLMALFGLRDQPDHGARAALNCAVDMLGRLKGINQRLTGEFATEIQIGIGIHTGQAIVGRMGPPRAPVLTALGDTVNTAARLESLSKKLQSPIVVSANTLLAAGLSGLVPLHQVEVRGRQSGLAVSGLDRETALKILGAARTPR